MPEVEETIQVAAQVPVALAEQLREKAKRNERSSAGEIRLALKAWVQAEEPEAEAA